MLHGPPYDSVFLWYSVAIIERAALQGREQEWNISRKELQELVLPDCYVYILPCCVLQHGGIPKL